MEDMQLASPKDTQLASPKDMQLANPAGVGLTIDVDVASASLPPSDLIASPKGVNKDPQNYTDADLDELLYGDIELKDPKSGVTSPRPPGHLPTSDNVVAIRRGTRLRKQSQKYEPEPFAKKQKTSVKSRLVTSLKSPDVPCQSKTSIPNNTPKQKIVAAVKNKTRSRIGVESHNKVWIRNTRRPHNQWAEKAAWLKKFRELQSDPVFQARSRAIVENFKKNYKPPVWNPDMQQYTNLLVSGVKKLISRLREEQITKEQIEQIFDEVHNDIKILCVNAFPFGTTIPLLAGLNELGFINKL